ncbi:hypothetical protein LCGC14_2594820, partial [marine sediment metagenome]
AKSVHESKGHLNTLKADLCGVLGLKHLDAFGVSVPNSAGFVDKDPSTMIPDNAVQSGQDMYYKEGKVLTTRFGYTRYNTSEIDASSGIRGLFGYYQVDGTRELIICSGTSLYRGNSGSPSKLTGADGLGLTNNLDWAAAQFADNLYLVNGTDAMVQVDNVTASTASGSPPLGTMVVEHKNMLFTAGNATNPNRLYFSAIGSATSWPATNFINIVTNDGSPITALVSLGDSLIIFKENHVYALDGASKSSFFVRRVSTEYGCAGIRAVCVAGNVVAFMDTKGPRAVLLDASDDFKDISTPLIPNTFNGLNDAQLSKCAVTFYKNLIVFNVTDSSSNNNNRRLVFDLDKGAWCVKWTRGFSIEVNYVAGSSRPYYSGNPTTGLIYQQDNANTDDGNEIKEWFRTKDYDLGVAHNPKRFRKLWAKAYFDGAMPERALAVDVYIDEDVDSSAILTFESFQGFVLDDPTLG